MEKLIACMIATAIVVNPLSAFAGQVTDNSARIAELESEVAVLQAEIDQLKAEDQAAAKELAEQNIGDLDTTYTLTTGNYTVGIDIPAGVCNVNAISGTGNISSSNLFNGGINEMFGIDDGSGYYIDNYSGLKLPEDVVLSLSSKLTVELSYTEITGGYSGREYDESEAVELANGSFTSGVDFPAGIYNIYAVNGTGNLSSSNIFDGGINEMFGVDEGSGYYTEEAHNIELPESTTLELSGGFGIRMVPAK